MSYPVHYMVLNKYYFFLSTHLLINMPVLYLYVNLTIFIFAHIVILPLPSGVQTSLTARKSWRLLNNVYRTRKRSCVLTVLGQLAVITKRGRSNLILGSLVKQQISKELIVCIVSKKNCLNVLLNDSFMFPWTRNIILSYL